MPFWAGVLEIIGFLTALVAWVMVPEVLWEHGHWLLAVVAFLLISVGLITVMNRYDEWRKDWLERHNRL
jgi:hypothetical protein